MLLRDVRSDGSKAGHVGRIMATHTLPPTNMAPVKRHGRTISFRRDRLSVAMLVRGRATQENRILQVPPIGGFVWWFGGLDWASHLPSPRTRGSNPKPQIRTTT